MTLPAQSRLIALRKSIADEAAGKTWIVRTIRGTALALGALTFVLLTVGPYDRAVAVSGRSEVISIRSDGTNFAEWSFPSAEFWPDPDGAAESGEVSMRIMKDAEARFVRNGRGPLTLSFTAPGKAQRTERPEADSVCLAGAARVGSARRASGQEMPFCDGATLTVAARPGDQPIVVSLRGAAAIGEEVRAGAGAQPILLDATVLLFVRHGRWLFAPVCTLLKLPSLCDRFVGMKLDVAAGDSLLFLPGNEKIPEATGFLRLDADDIHSGLLFDIAAPQASVEVRRLKGETFDITESVFDRIEKSPVIQALNTTLLALGLIWWFVRAPGAARGGHPGQGPPGPASLMVLSLLAATPARAEQAMLRAGEIGQAILRSRADRCYAVTPRHVLADETAASLTAPGRRLGDADLLRRVPAAPEDVMLLSVRAIPTDLCPAFEGALFLDTLLRTRAAAVMRLVRPDGSYERLPLSVQAVDVETFEVRPEEGTMLAQGMSGGTILVGDQPAGMLVDVEDGGKLGRAARLDRVFERLAPYLGTDVARAAAGRDRRGKHRTPAGGKPGDDGGALERGARDAGEPGRCVAGRGWGAMAGAGRRPGGDRAQAPARRGVHRHRGGRGRAGRPSALRGGADRARGARAVAAGRAVRDRGPGR